MSADRDSREPAGARRPAAGDAPASPPRPRAAGAAASPRRPGVRARSAAPRRPNGPTAVHEALQQYLKKAGLEERIEEAGAVPGWAERVGPGIAAVTTPLRVTGGTLVVAVRSSAWLMELKLMESTILRQVNEGRKHGKFARIRFVMAEG